MSANHESVAALFDEALKLRPEDRAAFLAAACGNNPDLRSQLDELLRAEAEAGDFLPESPNEADDVIAPLTEKEQPGSRIGRYKLLEKIGEGGCGVVYMAEQEEPVRRKVALKIIKLGLETKSVIARFEAERQALAMMDHPNIAKVFDGGVTESRAGVSPAPAAQRPDKSAPSALGRRDACPTFGRPYFVMELVRGVRITEYCEQHNLSTQERLDLFIQVCSAIQHAHQKGVIHRDIKPSNVLVTENDGKPVPKVIDFGIAKATEQKLTDKTLFTQFAAFIGTPAYMSPEQAALTSVDIDTRADIYSLGVLLYELLTGTTPFDAQELLKAGFDEMRRVIRETEPEKPSTRLTQRLGPGTGASGLRRHDAAFPSPPESPAAPGLPTCSQSVVLPPQSTESRRALFVAKELIHQLRGDLDWIVMKCLEKDRARRYETANGLAADLQRHLSNEPVLARPPNAAYRSQKMVRRNKVVFAAGAAVIAALVIGLGVSLWQSAEKTRAFRRAVAAEQEQLRLRRQAEAESRRATEEADIAKAVTDFLRNDVLRSAGSGYQRKSLKISPNPNLTVVEALDLAAKDIGSRFQDKPLVEAAIRYSIGRTYQDLGDNPAAIPHLARAVELYRVRPRVYDSKMDSAMDSLASAYSQAGRHADGVRLYEERFRFARERFGEESGITQSVLHNVGAAYIRAGRLNEGIAIMEKGIEWNKANGRKEDEDVASLGTLANAFAELRQPERAVEYGEKALKIAEATLGRDTPGTITLRHNLAMYYLEADRRGDALPLFEETLRLSRKHFGSEHAETLTTSRVLAEQYQKIGRVAEAESLFRESAEIVRKLPVQQSARKIRSLGYLADFLAASGQPAEAETVYREALQLTRTRAATVDDSTSVEGVLSNLAEVLYRQRRYAAAEPIYRELVERRQTHLPARDENVVGPTASLGRVLAEWAWADSTNKSELRNPNSEVAGRAREGERLLRECLAISAANTNTTRGRLGDTQSRLGAAVLSLAVTEPGLGTNARLARIGEAETLLISGQELLQQSKSIGPVNRRDSLERLVRLYTATARPDQAGEWQRKLEAFDSAEAQKNSASTREAPR